MVGRSEIVQDLKERLKKCQCGALQITFVAGPAGIGKSTLVREVLPHAHNFYVLEHHFFESLSTPYAPFVHLIRNVRKDFPSLAEGFPLFSHLGLLLPELKNEQPGIDKNALLAALIELLEAVTNQKPMLIVIEDSQWADTAALELIPLLTVGMHNLPICLLITYRDDQLARDHPLIRLRAHLRRQYFFSEVVIGCLNKEETMQLIAQQLPFPPDNALTDLIYKKTEGLPFFVKELTEALHEKGYLMPSPEGFSLQKSEQLPIPDTVRDMVALQLDGISVNAREGLELASLIGQEFDLDLLGDLAMHDEAIDELFSSTIIVKKDMHTGAFKHALVREVVRQQILWSKRKKLNLKIAEALEIRQAPTEQVGQYWLEAGEKRKACLAFAAASWHYCRLHAHGDAARTAHIALEIWPKGEDEAARLELLRQFGQCTRVSGQVHHSIMAYREILESPLMKHQPEKIGEINRDLAISYALQGAWQHYKQCRQAAAHAHEVAALWVEASKDWHDLTNRHIDELDLTAALDTIDHAIRCAVQAGQSGLQAKSLSLKGYVLSIQGKSKEGENIAREAVTLALAHNQVDASAYAYRKLAGTLEYASDFSGALQAYDTALNYCRLEKIDQQAQFCMSCMSWILFRMGDWKRGLEVCQEFIEAENINDASKAIGLLIIGLIRGLRGEIKTAHKYVSEAYALTVPLDYHLIDSILWWAMAMLDEQEEQKEKAYQHYYKILSLGREHQDIHDILPGLCSAASFFGEHTYWEESNQTLEVLTSIANLTGNAEALGTLSFALGEVTFLQKKYQEASEHFAQAAQAFEELCIPLQSIMALHRQGKALLQADHKPLAITSLQKASQVARSLGIRPMASSITALLAQAEGTGIQPKDQLQKGNIPQTELTPRQLEIIQALAEGLSNKEIAAKLYLSTRTVDMHVRHILDRLNCRSRTEAVRAALAQHLIEN